MAWVGGCLYVFLLLLLLGGAPRASGTVHAVGSLLAASLLAGVLRRISQWLAPGGILISDQLLADPALEPLPLPAGVAPGRYHLYRRR